MLGKQDALALHGAMEAGHYRQLAAWSALMSAYVVPCLAHFLMPLIAPVLLLVSLSLSLFVDSCMRSVAKLLKDPNKVKQE